ncbi:MAG: CDP-alcohol phosphatidyltransferase family protein [Gemmatimonadaceae bacterium]
MNLPNALTVARIAVTPLVAWLPFVESWPLRLVAFVIYIAAAVTDYWDGVLARRRNLITSLGAQLDPLADKLLLLGTFVPMWVLQRPAGDALARLVGLGAGAGRFWFELPGPVHVSLPWWVIAIVLGREAFMTAFRTAAARRGTVISAIGPAKWKTGFQMTWIGAAYFWFFAHTLAAREGWLELTPWIVFAWFNGIVGAVTMVVSVALTVYSLWLYLRRYGYVFRGARTGA